MGKKGIWLLVSLGLIWAYSPVFGYHPLSTDDPGTTEFRHFELEWGNDFTFPESELKDISGYVQIKAGLAKSLELDFAQGWTYWRDEPGLASSGWQDATVALKYRFYGDGDGPFNFALGAIFNLPSGESKKGLSEGDDIIPTLYLIGTAGSERVRVLMNFGASFYPSSSEQDPIYLYGLALEYSLKDNLALVGEIYGESDFSKDNPNDCLEGLVGAVYSVKDWLSLSAGIGLGLDEDSPDYRFTFASLIGW